MKGNTISRRTFIRQSGALGFGLAFHQMIPKVAPSDRLRIAHIGLGGMGNQHMNWFSALPEVEIVALCDVDRQHLDASLQSLQTIQPGNKAKGYGDFRQVLDLKDVDAITCATPDHWHAQIATLAFQAGKDVYGEKPLAFDVKEGQMMLKSLNKYKRVFQLGTQIHADDNYHRVVEIIRAGVIGKIHTVRLWKTGFPPELGTAQVQAPPAHLNWDMWLGPAPFADYIPQRCHFNYRYFLDYSGGVFQDFWCHIADIMYWSIQPEGLQSIHARGENQAAGSISDCPLWIDVDYEFDNLRVYWTHEPPDVPGAANRHIGAYFEGDKGTLLCDYGSREIRIDDQLFTDWPEVSITLERSPGHQQNFINAVKNRTQPESNLEYARRMTLPMHLGLISWRLKRKLNWNSGKEEFVGDREANQMLSREYRKKWNLV